MSLTRRQIRHKLYEMFGADNLGYHSSYTSRTTTTLTDYTRLGTLTGEFNHEGKIIYLPWGVSPYNVKRVGSTDNGVFTLADQAWPDTDAGNIYELLRADVYPDELNNCIRLGVRDASSVPTERPITIWDSWDGTGDGAFDEDNTTSWIAGSGTPTIEKSALSTHNLTGYKSLKVTNSAANDYIVHNVDVPVAPGERLYLAALSILLQGTSVSFLVYDATNAVQIGSTLTATGLVPYHMGDIYTVPQSCYAVNLRLGAASASSIVAWDALPGHSLTNKRFSLPDWVHEGWQITGFGPTRYDYQVADKVHTALSRKEYGWKRDSEWKPENPGENANPRGLRVMRDGDLPDCDLWIKGYRPESDADPLEDDGGTTNTPEDLVMAACVIRVCKMLKNKGDGTRWDDDIIDNQKVLDAHRSQRVDAPDPKPPSRLVVGRWG